MGNIDSIDLKQIDCQIFLQQNGFIRINRELQFGVCKHEEPSASPRTEREGECFTERKRKFGG